MGGRLSIFLQAWEWITLDQFVLGVFRQGQTLVKTRYQGCSSNGKPCGKKFHTASSRSPWSMSRYCRAGGGGGVNTDYFLVTKHTDGFRPTLNFSGLNTYLCVLEFHVETLSSISYGLHRGWWMVYLDLNCMCQSTPIIGSIFGWPSGTQQGSSLLFNGRFCLLACPLPTTAHLHLQGCLMHPYMDSFHPESSANQVACTRDGSLCCHFRLGFAINLQRSTQSRKIFLHDPSFLCGFC